MAKGKKYGDEIKERAVALYGVCGSYSQVARELGVPTSTIAGWIKNDTPEAEVVIKRLTAKMNFAEKAGELLNKGLDLLDRRLTTALEDEEALAELLEEWKNASNKEISDKKKQALMNKVASLQIQKIGDITSAISTLYDKRALAKGESTENTSITVELNGEIDEWAK